MRTVISVFGRCYLIKHSKNKPVDTCLLQESINFEAENPAAFCYSNHKKMKAFCNTSKNLIAVCVLIFFSFSIYLVSCDLSPAGDHYVEVEPPEENPNVNFLLSPDPDSLIHIFNKMVFNITPLIGNRAIRLVNVYVDEDLVKSVEGLKFSLDPRNFEPGLHLMEIEIIFSTGSGSLGDIVGVENYVIKYQREIYTDAQIPEPIDINSLTVTDEGRLRIDWDKFESIKFEKYVLCRWMTLNDHRNLFDTVEIFDMHQNCWIDSTLIFGHSRYQLILYTKFEDPLHGIEDEVYFNGPYCSLSIDSDEGYILEASWEPCQLFGNFKEYNISVSNPDTNFVLYTSDDPNVTTASFHVGIRKPSTYIFRDISNASASFQGGGSYTSDVFSLGSTTSEYDIMQHAPGGVFAINYYRLYYFDIYGNFIDKTNNLFSPANFIGVSDNGEFVLTNHQNGFAIFDPLNLGNVEIVHVTDIIVEDTGVVHADISNNGNIIAILENGEILGYNYLNNELLFLFMQPDAEKVISDKAGECFLVWNDELGTIIHYQYEGLPSPMPTAISNASSYPIVYTMENETRFLFLNAGTLEVWNLISLNNIQTVAVEFDNIVNLSENNILFAVDHEQTEFYFFDLSEMDIILKSSTDYIDKYLIYRYPTLFVKGRKFTLNL